ncbi:hypothetical protein D3Z45_15695 [Lachnospiraceae bacterium]|nr:hypothetical protein [Lachnospiraceae bacterium]
MFVLYTFLSLGFPNRKVFYVQAGIWKFAVEAAYGPRSGQGGSSPIPIVDIENSFRQKGPVGIPVLYKSIRR